MKVGILALQGAFIEHRKVMEELGVEVTEIRQAADFIHELDGLILPGGESTTIGKLLRELDLLTAIRARIMEGLPVFGTCAGMVLLAKELVNDDRKHLATMDIAVKRNGYGRQLGSFLGHTLFNEEIEIPMTFIRAPQIVELGVGVDSLAKLDGVTVAAQQNNQLVTAFHPELHENNVLHHYFIEMMKSI